jgi:flagella basal body P-ring formation protein FlgA
MNISSFYHLFGIFLLSVIGSNAVALGNNHPIFQDLSNVQSEVRELIVSLYQNETQYSDVKLEIGDIDPRLKLPLCDKELTYNIRRRSIHVSNMTVQVSCDGSNTWSFYVSTKVLKYSGVVVANKALSRGDSISLSDLRIETKEVSTLSNGYVTSKHDALGMIIKRSIRAGEALRQNSMSPPLLVDKGDQVMVTASTGKLSVSTHGIALADGRMGEQIRVKNLRSEKVIRARITDKGRVMVLL